MSTAHIPKEHPVAPSTALLALRRTRRRFELTVYVFREQVLLCTDSGLVEYDLRRWWTLSWVFMADCSCKPLENLQVIRQGILQRGYTMTFVYLAGVCTSRPFCQVLHRGSINASSNMVSKPTHPSQQTIMRFPALT